MTSSLRFFLLPLILLSTAATAGQSTVGTKLITVSIGDASCDDRRLRFHWAIANSSTEPVYLYSPFLRGPAAERESDSASHIYFIRTSLSKESDIAVNDYQPAKFIKLKPGQSMRGRFADTLGAVPPNGAVQLIFRVAFGADIRSVETDLRDGHYAHPANPIVRWQKVVESPPILLPECLGQRMPASKVE